MSRPDVREAYDHGAGSWRRGPEAVYARLADALVAAAPVPLAGARVLDVGAGTATAARAALARGADSAVASDIAAAMLHGRPDEVPAVVADLVQLPFRDRSFDLVTAAFCLGHLADPAAGLREIRRVGSAIVASAFPPGESHPAKAAIDQALAGLGYQAPDWYRHQKDVLEPRVDDPEALHRLAREAGFDRVDVRRIDVDTGLDTPGAAVDWRLGMAQLAPFVESLPPDVLARARAAAEEAVAPFVPVVLPILALTGF
jgi:ubiquinone/menaquinone biosynthesis C-methylase UbiE